MREWIKEEKDLFEHYKWKGARVVGFVQLLAAQ